MDLSGDSGFDACVRREQERGHNRVAEAIQFNTSSYGSQSGLISGVALYINSLVWSVSGFNAATFGVKEIT